MKRLESRATMKGDCMGVWEAGKQRVEERLKGKPSSSYSSMSVLLGKGDQ